MNEHIAVLIMRGWIESGSALPLRVQIRVVDDVSVGIEHKFELADVEDVVRVVRTWLERVERPVEV